MKKKALALSVLAAISSQAGAFQFDTPNDWNIRWDNTIKGNVMSRVNEAQNRIVDPAQNPAAAQFSDDADFSVNRKSGGFVSARADVFTELDVIWKDNWGFRVSASGWYDAAYENNDNPKSGVLPNGLPYDYSWAGLSYKPGDYSNKSEEMNLLGGELLDAFVFGGGYVGDMAWGLRAGKHTIYWGQSVFGLGALTGIAGSMAAIDFGKAFSVPGTEAKELFMPSAKISGSWQFTDTLGLSAYYEFDHLVHRYPTTGTYWSPSELLTQDTQLAVFFTGTATTPRTGLRNVDDKIQSSGEFGFNLGYTFEDIGLETQLVYIKGSDRLLSGVYGAFSTAGLDPEKIAQWAKPWSEGGANANVIGQWGWVYKKDIETFGISLSKEIAEISVGMDIVYRQNTGLNPEFLSSFTGRGAAQPSDWSPDPDDFPGPTGDVWGVVLNGIGFLSPDWGLWEGGSYVLEYTTSWLAKFKDNEAFAQNTRSLRKNRVTTQIGAAFNPSWYSVFPGWDLTVRGTVSYAIDGEQPPQSAVTQEELGNASIAVEFLVDQVWFLTTRYSHRFGPVANGVGGGLVDRDNVSFTVKRTF